MSKDEMRFLRRQIINVLLHKRRDYVPTLRGLMADVRMNELARYGQELKAYA